MATATRTQVAIIGGAPPPGCCCPIFCIAKASTASCCTAEPQPSAGADSAGVLGAGTVALLREVGLGARLDREGHPHDSSATAWEGRPRFFIETKKFTGKAMMAYGQTAITEDVFAARNAAGGWFSLRPTPLRGGGEIALSRASSGPASCATAASPRG